MADRWSSTGTVTVDPREWAAPRPSGLRRVVPILTWLRAYDRSDARFDLIAGATLWGLLVPEGIAYAGLAGLPPEAGLYTLLATLAAYVVFGTSRHLVVAATSATAVLLATAIASVLWSRVNTVKGAGVELELVDVAQRKFDRPQTRLSRGVTNWRLLDFEPKAQDLLAVVRPWAAQYEQWQSTLPFGSRADSAHGGNRGPGAREGQREPGSGGAGRSACFQGTVRSRQ